MQLKVTIERAILEDACVSLDSSALIAYLAGKNPHARFVTELLESNAKIVVSAITASESLMRTVEAYGRDFADDILASFLESSRMFLVPFDRVHVLETAAIRSVTRLKLPDAAIVATARLAGANMALTMRFWLAPALRRFRSRCSTNWPKEDGCSFPSAIERSRS